MMTNFVLTLLSVLFITGCLSIVDKELWKLDDCKHIMEMNVRVYPKTNGFYKILLLSTQNDQTVFANYFNLFPNGYFVSIGPPKYWSRFSKNALRNNDIGAWGRFEIANDSILIQYFFDTGVRGSFLPRIQHFTVYEGRGIVLNDSTILISKVKYKIAAEDNLKLPGIYVELHDPPLRFQFIRSDSIPPSDTWLIEELNKNKK
jgi:hypothetical protein